MSDTGLILPGQPAPPSDLTPGDDFDKQVQNVFAQFEKRDKALAAAANDTSPAVAEGDAAPALPADGPPGGWPSADEADQNASVRVDVNSGTVATPGAPAAPATPAPETPAPEAPVEGDASATGQDGVPAAGTSATPPGDAGAAAQPGEGDTAAVVTPPSGFTYRYHDGAVERETVIPDEQVNRALGLAVWAESLTPQVRDAFGAIETGQAVAIPRSEYDEWAAWKNTQAKTTRDADIERLDVDPDVATLIKTQRDELEAIKAQVNAGGQQQYVDPAMQARVNAGAEQDAKDFAAAQASYAASRGLDSNEVESLLEHAVRGNIIPNLVEQQSVYSPTGQLVQRAPIGTIAEQALDWALVQNPALRTKALSTQQNAAANGVQQGTPLPGTQPAPAAPDPVERRKARASSLATAPSGTTPAPPPQQVAAMTQQQVTQAMAQELEAVLRS